MKKTLVRLGLVLVALPLLTSCAAISALSSATQPLDVYELRAPGDIVSSDGRAAAQDVIVELPTTSGALATDRIMIRPNTLQAQYLPDVRWSEPTPVMVQTLMLRSIEATGRVRYVGRTPLGTSGDFALVTEVIDFQAELSPDEETTIVRIKFLVRMVRERDARIVASRTFDASAASTSTETAAILEAFSSASDQVFVEFANWLRTAL
ncbi:ABC-type transport auxiliary lipoprotein family protein [Marivita sp. S0852]|uniref:ABC-type transport auxiliary lipoprotein family protein n=1 Tax=Marivita sp. S0852 TaxID=3373893 RepID=UPI003982B80D